MTRLEKIACICVPLLSFGVLVFVALQLGWVAKVASLGDVLTLGSIVVAAILAFFGWRRADKVACEERERIAKADAVIMYKRLNPVNGAAMHLLVNFVSPDSPKFAAHSLDPNIRNEANKSYAQLWGDLCSLQDLIPNTDEYFHSLRSFYIYKHELGDKFLNVLSAIQILNMNFEKYSEHVCRNDMSCFCEMPNDQKRTFFKIFEDVVLFLILLEDCRNELESVELYLSHMNEKLLKLVARLEELQGISKFKKSSTINVDQEIFSEILQDADQYFRSRRVALS
ncbi:MAG: hypothetical protein ACJAVO_001981 [Parvibaculaceae bacterium]|jgi:hypothetical protein